MPELWLHEPEELPGGLLVDTAGPLLELRRAACEPAMKTVALILALLTLQGCTWIDLYTVTHEKPMSPVFNPHLNEISDWEGQVIVPPAPPEIFSRPRILASHVETFRSVLRTVKGTQSVLVIGWDLGHVVAVLARTGLGVYWLTGTHGHDRAFGKPMSAVIISDELRQTNALAWSASHALQAGGLLFVPESMILMDDYLHFYGLERTGLKMKQFLEGGYYVIFKKGSGQKTNGRITEAA